MPHLDDVQLKELLTKLCSKCTSGKKEEHRDIAVIGLKTTVVEVASKQGDVLVDIVVPTLIDGIGAKASTQSWAGFWNTSRLNESKLGEKSLSWSDEHRLQQVFSSRHAWFGAPFRGEPSVNT